MVSVAFLRVCGDSVVCRCGQRFVQDTFVKDNFLGNVCPACQGMAEGLAKAAEVTTRRIRRLVGRRWRYRGKPVRFTP